jgi:hypothetical protein
MLSQEFAGGRVANEIVKSLVVDPAVAVSGRVRRGDGKTYTRPRKTLWSYKDEPWPALPAGVSRLHGERAVTRREPSSNWPMRWPRMYS